MFQFQSTSLGICGQIVISRRYATFRIHIPSTLSEEQCLKVLDIMAESGTQKVTFVGGEPTLCPFLGSLIKRAKELGIVTMLVTNGSRLRTKVQRK